MGKWTNSQAFDISFEPEFKQILPKETVSIEIKLTPKKGDDFQELFICKVQGLKFPLGFQLKLSSRGIECALRTLRR